MRIPAADRPLLRAWFAVTATAIALSIAVSAGETPFPGEADAIHRLQGWPFPGQTLSDAVRSVTTSGIVIILGTLMAAGLYVRGARREALTLLGLLIVVAWLQPALKELIDRPRPSPEEFDVRADVTSPSFPSGHAMTPAVLYGYVIALCLTWPRLARIAAASSSVGVLLLTGLVSVWLGVHWPSDVVGGYLWGAALVLGGVYVSRVFAR